MEAPPVLLQCRQNVERRAKTAPIATGNSLHVIVIIEFQVCSETVATAASPNNADKINKRIHKAHQPSSPSPPIFTQNTVVFAKANYLSISQNACTNPFDVTGYIIMHIHKVALPASRIFAVAISVCVCVCGGLLLPLLLVLKTPKGT